MGAGQSVSTSKQKYSTNQGESNIREDEEQHESLSSSSSSEASEISSLEQDEDDKKQRRKKKVVKEEELMEHPSKIAPQRRCHYLDIPVGTSGQLTRRVFEVRLRSVDECPVEDQVIPKQPYLSHATTDMIIVRWEMASWADAKKISNLEVQFKQPALKKGNYLQLWTYDRTHEEGKEETKDFDDDAMSEPDEAAKKVEVLCDGHYCTVPNNAVKQIDLRYEMKLFGFQGDCDPLYFRVRAKVGHLGWSKWSKISDPIATLPKICLDLNPQIDNATAHALHLKWSIPNGEKTYGKVVQYKLYGAMIDKHKRLGQKAMMEYCEELENRLNDPSKEQDVVKEEQLEWISLYEGVEESFGIGYIGERKEEWVSAAQNLLTSTLCHKKTNSQACGLEHGLLPADWPFLFRIEAKTGAWFHGTFHTNCIMSPIRCIWTLVPIADPPAPPVALNYHGMVLSKSVTLHFTPPTTYGNGHDAATHHLMFPFKNAVDWFGINVATAGTGEQASTSWAQFKRTSDELKHTERFNLSKDGWTELIDPTTQEPFWKNSLTGKTSWQNPENQMMEVYEYRLHGRLAGTEVEHKFKSYYQGPRRHVTIENLYPDTAYEFILSVRLTRAGGYGFSKWSHTFRVRTAELAKEKLLLPENWVELWDPTTEFVYYHEKESKLIQWQHPCGPELDDPDLAFRKKRFKLLHRLYEHIPPAQNVETLKMTITRANLLEDSLEQLGLVSSTELRRRLNITFEGEDGIDSGGITTEWYILLSKAFFEGSLGLTTRHEASQLYAINDELENYDTEKSRYFHFMGRIMAKAIYDKRLLCVPFCSYVWRHLLNCEPTMEDLQQVDPLFHQSLIWILNNDITDIIFETFTTTTKDGETVDVVPNGSNIDVTEENKEEYVKKIVQYKLSIAVSQPIRDLKKGFYEIIPPHELDHFDVADIDLLVNGSSDIPIKELRRTARYGNGYNERSKPVQYFWNIFQEASQYNQGRILAFVTGSSKMPLDGVSIQIIKDESTPDSLPHSHTCFHQLVFPVYESQQQFSEKLFLALENSSGFYMT